ncbi:MAG: ABC transporter substrate-binding protein [Oleiphilaceae bacterium]|nr:ABC transporter substrate-binding protein [Oleiphilaceae bacterium]
MFRFLFACLFISQFTFAAQPVYIGLDADMSAVAKEGGEAIRRGALIAIDEINTNGGILGRPLELVVKDHRGNPARGIVNIQQFAKLKDLVAVIGGVHTPVVLKELPVIHENSIIYLDPWAAGTPIVDNGFEPNYVFRISVRDQEAGKVLVAHAKKRGAQKIGLLLERTGWGRSNEKSMSQAAATHGLSITKIQWFNWGQKDFTKDIEALIEAGSEAILLVANAPEGAGAAEAILRNEHARKLPLISHWGLSAGTFVEQLGLSKLAQLDLVVLQTYSFTHPHSKKINERVLNQYKKLFDNKVTAESVPGAVGTAHAYDMIHLLAKAIAQAGSLDRPAIRTALEQIEEHIGLVKHYQPPFTAERHDALWAEDYIMSRFNSEGHLIPLRN